MLTASKRMMTSRDIEVLYLHDVEGVLTVLRFTRSPRAWKSVGNWVMDVEAMSFPVAMDCVQDFSVPGPCIGDRLCGVQTMQEFLVDCRQILRDGDSGAFQGCSRFDYGVSLVSSVKSYNDGGRI